MRHSHPTVRLIGSPEIYLRDISKTLEDTRILRRLSLHVPAGKVTVLMGPSGVGKSTLIKHVTGLLEPDEGAVEIGEFDVWSLGRSELLSLRSRIGSMIGGSYLVSASTFGSLTVLENLTYTLEAVKVPHSERHPRVLAMMRELELTRYYDRLPDQLPAHVTRRLALAKALILDAPLCVLDEIDVGMDEKQASLSIGALRALRARIGGTYLITTHSIPLAHAIADKVAVLVEGRIVAHGPPGDVLGNLTTTEDFAELFTMR